MSTSALSGLLVRSDNETWHQPSQAGYLNEHQLRDLLAAQPSLIPGVGPGAVAVREFQSGVGPSDLCVVDGDGSVTIVECKLATNQEVRRKIIGQVLDYASRVWRMSLQDFDDRWRQRSGGTSVLDVLGDDEAAVSALSQNLAAGRLSLVLAVDVINDDLQRIVQFLNGHTGDTLRVLALELAYAKHGGTEILVPRSYGLELSLAGNGRAAGSAGWQTRWTPDDVTGYIDEHHPEIGNHLKQFLQSAQGLGCSILGTGAVSPSLIVRAELPEGVIWPYAVYTTASPRLQVNFVWLRNASEASRWAFAEALADHGLIAALPDAAFKTKPSIPLVKLLDDAARQALLDALAKLIATD